MNSPSLLLALLLALPVLGAGAPPALEWKQDTQSLALYQEGKPVWVFHHSPQQGAKPFFHPLALPGGAPLTCQSPSDHSWHYGLWFSWKYLNGVNYWEQNSKGASDGATAWDPPRFETLPDHRARIQLDLRYHPRSHSVPVLSERRSIDLSAPAADGAYFMDWTLVFTAGETNVTLDRTPPARQNGQTIPGGYAGLSARFSTNLTSARLAANAPAGPLLNNRHGYAATASDFSGLLPSGETGLAILDHPANPRQPSRWYAILESRIPFWFLNAAWLQSEPFVLPARQTLTLRYRVHIHPGRWDGARLESERLLYARQQP